MRKFNLSLLLLLFSVIALSQENLWSPISESITAKNMFANRYKPTSYKLFQLNEASLITSMRNAPSEKSVSASASGFIITVPNAEGQPERYRVVEAPVMDPALAARYPEIKSYAGTGIDAPGSTIRFDISPRGFYGMILSADRPTIYIDPIDREDKYYVVFARNNAPRTNLFECMTNATPWEAGPSTRRTADDGRLRTYRLALACTGEYSQFFLNGTETTDAQRKAKVLAAMNTLMVRTNGIYERDFGIRMNLIANNDAIIYLTASTDPWTSEWNIKTQQTIDAVIGNANYDIGHLVHRGSNNGNAGCIACVCKTWNGSTNPNTFVGKGGGFTSHTVPEGDPFVVDYTTHEMGHQFGANHTFTFSNETGTASQFEPGSGSTIMGYAGITGSTDVQPHSDDYFHARSIEQISDYIKTSTGGGCAVTTITGNTAPTANAGADFTIPRSTPFTLTGSATDVDAADVLTYTWEQYNTGTSSTTFPSTTATSGPLFRSRTGGTGTSRTFPILSSILDGTNGNQWERLPGVARTLSFRLTVKDNHAGGGNGKQDDMSVTIAGSAGPFAVSAPNTAVTWAGGSTQTVTWSVNSTNAAPVNCANVRISLSTDGGLTFPTVLVASTANDGSQSVVIPNTPSSTARIKVEAVGNIFFDISNVNFTISTGGGTCNAPAGLTNSAVTNNSATISWSAAAGAVSYDVDYKTNASATWTNAATGTTSLSANLSSLTAATLYDWRVRTNCSSGSSSYATAQFTTLNTPSGCVNAFEANNTQATAASVAVNTVHSAAIGVNGDIDFYTFTTTTTSNFNITLTNLPGDYDIFLLNSSGTQLAASENGGTSSESIVSNNRAAGTYYVRIIGWNGAFSNTVCYNLNIGVSSSGCISPLDNSTNGTSAGAATIPFNTNVTGLISPSGDNDYYRFVITTGGTATITLSTLPADYDLVLYSSNGTTQLAISENGGTSSETISRTFTAGTYFVRVYGWNGANSSTVCYTLRVQLGTATRNDQLITELPLEKVTVSPNPVRNIMKVNLPLLKGTSMLNIVDMTGKTVLQRQVNTQTSQLDLSGLPAGIYLVSVRHEGKTISTTKIIKE